MTNPKPTTCLALYRTLRCKDVVVIGRSGSGTNQMIRDFRRSHKLPFALIDTDKCPPLNPVICLSDYKKRSHD